MKWLENTVQMSLTILRIESFVETGVRDLENELFSKIIRVIRLWRNSLLRDFYLVSLFFIAL